MFSKYFFKDFLGPANQKLRSARYCFCTRQNSKNIAVVASHSCTVTCYGNKLIFYERESSVLNLLPQGVNAAVSDTTGDAITTTAGYQTLFTNDV